MPVEIEPGPHSRAQDVSTTGLGTASVSKMLEAVTSAERGRSDPFLRVASMAILTLLVASAMAVWQDIQQRDQLREADEALRTELLSSRDLLRADMVTAQRRQEQLIEENSALLQQVTKLQTVLEETQRRCPAGSRP